MVNVSVGLFIDKEDGFVREISAFAKQMFTSSYADSADKKGSSSTPSGSVKINFGDLAVENTSASVQLVLWAMSDESGM